MTLASKDMELIKQEVAGIRDFYQSRWDSELPPLKEEVGRVAAQLSRIQELWRDGEKRDADSRLDATAPASRGTHRRHCR